jgi:hypothetical protein
MFLFTDDGYCRLEPSNFGCAARKVDLVDLAKLQQQPSWSTT